MERQTILTKNPRSGVAPEPYQQRAPDGAHGDFRGVVAAGQALQSIGQDAARYASFLKQKQQEIERTQFQAELKDTMLREKIETQKISAQIQQSGTEHIYDTFQGALKERTEGFRTTLETLKQRYPDAAREFFKTTSDDHLITNVYAETDQNTFLADHSNKLDLFYQRRLSSVSSLIRGSADSAQRVDLALTFINEVTSNPEAYPRGTADKVRREMSSEIHGSLIHEKGDPARAVEQATRAFNSGAIDGSQLASIKNHLAETKKRRFSETFQQYQNLAGKSYSQESVLSDTQLITGAQQAIDIAHQEEQPHMVQRVVDVLASARIGNHVRKTYLMQGTSPVLFDDALFEREFSVEQIEKAYASAVSDVRSSPDTPITVSRDAVNQIRSNLMELRASHRKVIDEGMAVQLLAPDSIKNADPVTQQRWVESVGISKPQVFGNGQPGNPLSVVNQSVRSIAQATSVNPQNGPNVAASSGIELYNQVNTPGEQGDVVRSTVSFNSSRSDPSDPSAHVAPALIGATHEAVAAISQGVSFFTSETGKKNSTAMGLERGFEMTFDPTRDTFVDGDALEVDEPSLGRIFTANSLLATYPNPAGARSVWKAVYADQLFKANGNHATAALNTFTIFAKDQAVVTLGGVFNSISPSYARVSLRDLGLGSDVGLDMNRPYGFSGAEETSKYLSATLDLLSIPDNRALGYVMGAFQPFAYAFESDWGEGSRDMRAVQLSPKGEQFRRSFVSKLDDTRSLQVLVNGRLMPLMDDLTNRFVGDKALEGSDLRDKVDSMLKRSREGLTSDPKEAKEHRDLSNTVFSHAYGQSVRWEYDQGKKAFRLMYHPNISKDQFGNPGAWGPERGVPILDKDGLPLQIAASVVAEIGSDAEFRDSNRPWQAAWNAPTLSLIRNSWFLVNRVFHGKGAAAIKAMSQ